MTELSKEERDRAEARFKAREAQKLDAPIATREYHDAQEAVRRRTRQLRAERLARERAG